MATPRMAARRRPRSIAALAQADIAAFHDAWWRPDNAILVIAGDITPEAGFALAEALVRRLGEARGARCPPRLRPQRRGAGAARHRHRRAADRPGRRLPRPHRPGAHRRRLFPDAGRQQRAGRRLFGAAQRGDPHQARPLLRRQFRLLRAQGDRADHRLGADPQRCGAAGHRPDGRRVRPPRRSADPGKRARLPARPC